MTHSLRACAVSLLRPERCFSVSEIRNCPSIVPAEPGIYGWWFSGELSGVPVAGTQRHDGWRLLYVGIAPSRASASARRPRTLRDRLKNHCFGPAATSTLRRTLACLLQCRLKLQLSRNASGKLCMRTGDEARLSSWMDRNARVAWVCLNEPWLLEYALITCGKPCLPLNIKGSSHSFRLELKELRKVAGKVRSNRERSRR